MLSILQNHRALISDGLFRTLVFNTRLLSVNNDATKICVALCKHHKNSIKKRFFLLRVQFASRVAEEINLPPASSGGMFMLPELNAFRRMRVGVGRPVEFVPLELRDRVRPFFELFGVEVERRRLNSGNARTRMPSVTGSIVNL